MAAKPLTVDGGSGGSGGGGGGTTAAGDPPPTVRQDGADWGTLVPSGGGWSWYAGSLTTPPCTECHAGRVDGRASGEPRAVSAASGGIARRGGGVVDETAGAATPRSVVDLLRRGLRPAARPREGGGSGGQKGGATPLPAQLW